MSAPKVQLNVQSHVYDLSELDAGVSCAYIPLIYYYPNTDGHDGFMQTELLQRALYAVIEEYPMLVGNVRQVGPGKLQLVVDGSNPRLPSWREVQSPLEFSQIEAGRFDPQLLPAGALIADVFYVGSNWAVSPEMADIRLTRFKNNSGVALAISICHAIFDGFACDRFIQRWASICHDLATNTTPGSNPDDVIHDRTVIDQLVPYPQGPLLDVLLKMYIPGSYLSRFVAWASPETRNWVLRTLNVSSDISAACFYISQTTVDSLRQSIKDILATSERISDNDVLIALLMIGYAPSALAQRDHDSAGVLGWLTSTLKHPFIKKHNHFAMLEAADIRPRISDDRIVKYTGNCPIAIMMRHPVELLQTPPSLEILAHLALSVRTATNGLTDEYIAQIIHGGNTETDMYIRPLICKIGVPERLIATNFGRFGLYKTDFGWNIPAYVGTLNAKLPKAVAIFPSHPSDGGYYFNISEHAGILQRMRANTFWAKYTESIY